MPVYFNRRGEGVGYQHLMTILVLADPGFLPSSRSWARRREPLRIWSRKEFQLRSRVRRAISHARKEKGKENRSVFLGLYRDPALVKNQDGRMPCFFQKSFSVGLLEAFQTGAAAAPANSG